MRLIREITFYVYESAKMLTNTLPGLTFQTVPPPLPETLPRMDIAAFVGFAASGPVNIPVAVEDVTRFRDIFGADVALAWDEATGQQQHGYLGVAVEAFFANGGRRCWVVRVAQEGQTTRFGLPHLLSAETHTPLTTPARSPGSWADDLRVGTRLRNDIFPALALNDMTLHLPTVAPFVTQHDLLKLDFPEAGLLLYAVVTRIDGLMLELSQPHWFRRFEDGMGVVSAEIHPHHPLAPLRIVKDGDQVALTIIPTPHLPQRGAIVRVRLDNDATLLLSIAEVEPTLTADSPPEEEWIVRGTGLQIVNGNVIPPTETPIVTRLRFDLAVWREQQIIAQLTDLACAPDHPRFWGNLPSDDDLFDLRIGDAPRKLTLLDSLADEPRFPLAGDFSALTLPFGMESRFTITAGADVGDDALVWDGLGVFSADLFLDPHLATTRSQLLLAEAHDKQYVRGARLTGLHTVLPLTEVTLITIPDAIQHAWRAVEQPVMAILDPPVLESVAVSEMVDVRWSAVVSATGYLLESATEPTFAQPRQRYAGEATAVALPIDGDCPTWTYWRVRATFGSETSAWSNTIGVEIPHDSFDVCGFALNVATELERLVADELSLQWSAVDGATKYEWQGSADPLFTTVHTTSEVDLLQVRVGRISADVHYYRVRAHFGDQIGVWSNTVRYPDQHPVTTRWERNPQYDDTTLLTLQHALLRLCVARGDLFALLALPAHYRAAAATAHAEQLISRVQWESARDLLSYGALYHTWLTTQRGQTIPPTGAICGQFASRALTHGAWIAPANEPLNTVVALTPTTTRSEWATLFAAQINVVRQDPRGFMLLSAETLSRDGDFRPINVRRLFILLRRLALREGNKYVFGAHSTELRRLIRHKFELFLADLYGRGAFAGATPDQAYRVVIDETLNTRSATERGQLIIELRVAPSHPLAFLTLRLVQHEGLEVV